VSCQKRSYRVNKRGTHVPKKKKNACFPKYARGREDYASLIPPLSEKGEVVSWRKVIRVSFLQEKKTCSENGSQTEKRLKSFVGGRPRGKSSRFLEKKKKAYDDTEREGSPSV